MFDNFSSEETASLLFSLLILLFLLNSIFSRKNLRISVAIKYLLIWGILILLVLSVYSYRFELQNFKEKILLTINPSKPLVKNNQIIIEASDDGHYYLDSKINDVAIKFMVDTGASDVVIDKNMAKKVGINLQNLIFNKRFLTANGEALAASTKFDKFQIDKIIFENVKASVSDSNQTTALLGISFLKKFKKYEFYQNQLILTL